ncbi:hypothetical protein [Nonomuraea sp. KM90]|uniref:hypothetical protein n=1 Tax=Nonomuraea sp. KM90 TaxID=3457428 RepID=UPI003FCE1F79
MPAPTFQYTYSDRLPSRNNGLAFVASIRVYWRRDPSNGSQPTSPRIVARTIRAVVEGIAQQSSVLRLHVAEEEIEEVLRKRLPFVDDGAEILNAHVSLTVDQETLDSAMRLERLLHEQELDELARRQAKGRADFLRDVMLKDPASARIYTMFELSPRIGGPSAHVDLDRLVQQVNDWHPEARWIGIAQILHDFLNGLSEGGRKDLLNIIQHAISLLGTPHQAARFSDIAGEPDGPVSISESSMPRLDE